MKYTLFLIHELTVQIEYSRRTAFIKRGFYRVYWCYQIGVYIICTESGIKCQSTSSPQFIRGLLREINFNLKYVLRLVTTALSFVGSNH